MYMPIPHRNTFGKESFTYWENFLTDDELDYLRDHPLWDQKEAAQVGGSNDGGVVNSNIRRSGVSWLTPDNDNLLIFNKITSVVAEVNRRHFHLDIDGCYEPAQLTYYDASMAGEYDWHVDGCPSDAGVPRKLSMSLLLNEPSEFIGGDFEVMSSSATPTTLSQRRGRAWFFPSYLLHKVSPVVSGHRKSLVLWVGGPQFR